MKSSFKKLPGSKIALEVELDQQEFLEYYRAAEEKARQSVRLKGFRPGMAPKELADQAIDREQVFHEAADNAVRRSLHGAIEENQWVVIDKPQVELLEHPKNKGLGLRYKAELTMYPEVKLGDYKRVAKRVLKEKKAVVVGDDEVNKAVEWLRNSRASETRVLREATLGDLVDADITTSVEGKQLQGAGLKHDRFILGESNFVPGFDGNLIGRKSGDAFDFSLMAPPDYWNKELQGKQLDVHVKLNDVYERKLPELNDAFAQGIGPNFKTLGELQLSVRAGLTKEKQTKEDERIRIALFEEIVAASTIDLPQIMVEKTVDRLLANLKHMAEKLGKTDAELREGLRERAERNVRSQLVMQALAKTERLEPTEEEIRAETQAKHLDAQTYYDYSYGVVQQKKVFKFLESQEH